MNKSKTLVWWDDEVKDSYLLSLEPYNLKLLKAVNTENRHETEITVYGDVDDVNRFIEDVEDDSLEPFEKISMKFDDCDEYYAEIKDKVTAFCNFTEYESAAADSSVVDWENVW